MVSQGDLLHGDTNGVTSIPLRIAAAVADLSPEFVAAEKIILDYLRAPGAKTVAGYSAARQEYGRLLRASPRRPRRAGRRCGDLLATVAFSRQQIEHNSNLPLTIHER